jgi:hypothetical protein
MDLLRSFNLDELPEQQTRTLHLIAENPDFDLSLGFDACCTCGKKVGPDCPPISCRNCRRVDYCSDTCRHQDANVSLPISNNDEQETDSALGHSAVVCAVLRLCQDDEAVDNNEDMSNLDSSRIQAAKDRIHTEKESYPATIANVVAEGPCYVQKLRSCSTSRKLVFHVIGASVEGELWDYKDGEEDSAFAKAYADALVGFSDSYNLDTIELVFLGPECPEMNVKLSISMQSTHKDSPSGDLLIRTIKGHYTVDLLKQSEVSKADIVVFFNPGFTVPDYSWTEMLSCIEKGTPFLSTTNTELEGIADCQYLLDQDKIQTIPPGLSEIFGLYSSCDDGEESSTNVNAFFSENPFCGSRVRQNGTMANDLFVKNHWMLGGILDTFDPSKANENMPSKKLKSAGGSANSKASNRALI